MSSLGWAIVAIALLASLQGRLTTIVVQRVMRAKR